MPARSRSGPGCFSSDRRQAGTFGAATYEWLGQKAGGRALRQFRAEALVEARIASKASFGLLWMCGVCLRLTVLAVPPVIAMIQRDLNLSGTEIGLLSGIPIFV